MTATQVDTDFASFLEQQNDTRGLSDSERDRLIVSLRKTNGKLCIVSRFGDSAWWIMNLNRNVTKSNTKIDFDTLPVAFREQAKAILYRYMRRGASGFARTPAGSSVVRFFRNLKSFLEYLKRVDIHKLSDVTPAACANYLNAIETKKNKFGKIAYKKSTVAKMWTLVDQVYELSQHTDAPISTYPFSDFNYRSEASRHPKRTRGKKRYDRHDNKTPLMPDDVFSTLFSSAWSIVDDAARLFRLESNLQSVRAKSKQNPTRKYVTMLKTPALRDAGFNGSYFDFKARLKSIRIACYIVIASLSGCRIHELAHMQKGGYYSTVEADGERYWWLRSDSNKTYEGPTEWMVPEAAITAVRVLEEWAAPYQEKISEEIASYREQDVDDVRIAEAQAHERSLLLGRDYRNAGQVRTLGTQAINNELKAFAKECGLTWIPTTHQFRRKFANYAARSKFGDLRYLRVHFKHWSIDMTLGYALNESQEMALFLEIQDELDNIKAAVVDSWLDRSEPLAGGYGERLVAWRDSSESVIMFESRSDMVRSIADSTHIRSNGHAWCTADDRDCVGNDFEKTRCGAGCDHAVVGRAHAEIYEGIFGHLKELRSAKDIGPGGRARVKVDLKRCAGILRTLGADLEQA
ncbi:MAG TPA: hypothetical protein VHC91_14655 [Trinickia sp.]|uniref:hypothetical protein n=1 Tax=Trinickia sp. TaxID=2571163 RepID=UPI002D0D3ED8|nr:hypothetical protein [Trinickia sp.]HVW51615.1 hypothetical protein [Trinickia sp.]